MTFIGKSQLVLTLEGQFPSSLLRLTLHWETNPHCPPNVVRSRIQPAWATGNSGIMSDASFLHLTFSPVYEGLTTMIPVNRLGSLQIAGQASFHQSAFWHLLAISLNFNLEAGRVAACGGRCPPASNYTILRPCFHKLLPLWPSDHICYAAMF